MTRPPRWYGNGLVIWLCTGLPIWLTALLLSGGHVSLASPSAGMTPFEWVIVAWMFFPLLGLPVALIEMARRRGGTDLGDLQNHDRRPGPRGAN